MPLVHSERHRAAFRKEVKNCNYHHVEHTAAQNSAYSHVWQVIERDGRNYDVVGQPPLQLYVAAGQLCLLEKTSDKVGFAGHFAGFFAAAAAAAPGATFSSDKSVLNCTAAALAFGSGQKSPSRTVHPAELKATD